MTSPSGPHDGPQNQNSAADHHVFESPANGFFSTFNRLKEPDRTGRESRLPPPPRTSSFSARSNQNPRVRSFSPRLSVFRRISLICNLQDQESEISFVMKRRRRKDAEGFLMVFVRHASDLSIFTFRGGATTSCWNDAFTKCWRNGRPGLYHISPFHFSRNLFPCCS